MTYKSILFLCLSLIPLVSDAALREWTDRDGRTMQAEFVRTERVGATIEVVFQKSDAQHYRVPMDRLCQDDQSVIRELEGKTEPPIAAANTPPQPKTEFEQGITKDLVKLRGSRLKKVPESELEPKDYYLIYYSAHWCPPCRKFTPKLVDFYEDTIRKHKNFELIFVSSDRSKEAMEDYMDEADMPWPALDFDKKKTSKALTGYAGRGIPCLVLVDNQGTMLSHSYVNKEYVGPTAVMEFLEQTLDK